MVFKNVIYLRIVILYFKMRQIASVDLKDMKTLDNTEVWFRLLIHSIYNTLNVNFIFVPFEFVIVSLNVLFKTTELETLEMSIKLVKYRSRYPTTKSLLLVKNVRIFTHIKLISFLRDIVNIVYALRTSKETELYCHGYSHENEQRIRLHDFAGLPLIFR